MREDFEHQKEQRIRQSASPKISDAVHQTLAAEALIDVIEMKMPTLSRRPDA
jgi:hypothetical protein